VLRDSDLSLERYDHSRVGYERATPSLRIEPDQKELRHVPPDLEPWDVSGANAVRADEGLPSMIIVSPHMPTTWTWAGQQALALARVALFPAQHLHPHIEEIQDPPAQVVVGGMEDAARLGREGAQASCQAGGGKILAPEAKQVLPLALQPDQRVVALADRSAHDRGVKAFVSQCPVLIGDLSFQPCDSVIKRSDRVALPRGQRTAVGLVFGGEELERLRAGQQLPNVRPHHLFDRRSM
jgi:hypothetical protein